MSSDKALAEEALERVAATLGHPRRVRILSELVKGPGSASSLRKKLTDLTVSDIDYHLKVLVKAKAIEQIDSRKGRGATELIYGLAPEASWQVSWELIPLPILAGLRKAWQGKLVQSQSGLAAEEPPPIDPIGRTVTELHLDQ
jgi:DNA-binding transcriptional ArsR family regulator